MPELLISRLLWLRRNVNETLFFKTRPMIRFCNIFFGNKPVVGVEIGTEKGMNALDILRNMNVSRLYCIDPYMMYDERGEMVSVVKSRMRYAYNHLMCHPEVTMIRKPSGEAYKDIIGLVDFVYIDGNHDYDFVMDDIRKYYPLIKKGGVIGGHDFNGSYLDVIRAVDDSFKLHMVQSWLDDWWMIKI